MQQVHFDHKEQNAVPVKRMSRSQSCGIAVEATMVIVNDSCGIAVEASIDIVNDSCTAAIELPLSTCYHL